jgi:hypothetical protein
MGESSPSSTKFNDSFFDDIDKLVPDFGASDSNWTESRKQNLSKALKLLVSAVRESFKTVTALKDENARLKSLVNSKTTPSDTALELSWSNVVSGKKPNEQTQALFASVNKELNDKAKIANNVVITGLGVGDDSNDNKRVDEVLAALKLDRSKDVKSHRRIKSNRNATDQQAGKALDMIVVEFNSEEIRTRALVAARALKNDPKLNKVYINPDRTPSERALDHHLRTERNKLNSALPKTKDDGRQRYGVQPSDHPKAGKKFYWGIRSNALREIYFD